MTLVLSLLMACSPSQPVTSTQESAVVIPVTRVAYLYRVDWFPWMLSLSDAMDQGLADPEGYGFLFNEKADAVLNGRGTWQWWRPTLSDDYTTWHFVCTDPETDDPSSIEVFRTSFYEVTP